VVVSRTEINIDGKEIARFGKAARQQGGEASIGDIGDSTWRPTNLQKLDRPICLSFEIDYRSTEKIINLNLW
jgi:hypothetical protein